MGKVKANSAHLVCESAEGLKDDRVSLVATPQPEQYKSRIVRDDIGIPSSVMKLAEIFSNETIQVL